ncbi:hypothetical protein FQA39_LY10459 [Lamprigera yunnana]|nr:hypothetical protein FQA39_LY10459 [Lamprigera yunnana]
MAYAEPYWTKAVDLRSTVERLDKEISALEFDANREGVYGLEKYYTIREYRIKEHIKDYSHSEVTSDDGREKNDNKHANTAKEEQKKE